MLAGTIQKSALEQQRIVVDSLLLPAYREAFKTANAATAAAKTAKAAAAAAEISKKQGKSSLNRIEDESSEKCDSEVEMDARKITKLLRHTD